MENDNNQNSGSGDSKSDAATLESVDNAILTVDNSEVDDTEEDNDAVFHKENQLALDAKVYITPEYKETGANEPNRRKVKSYNYIETNALHTIVSNRRALPESATTYKLESFRNNALVIFNHKKCGNLEPRVGTEEDVKALKATFENVGFLVEIHNDFTKDALIKELKKFSERNFTNYGCVAVAILTHGSDNGKLWAKDQHYNENQVIKNFLYSERKPTLVTKPKIFIIQACRGSKISTSVPVQVSDKNNLCIDGENNSASCYTLPEESDLLLIHSSYSGRASVRNLASGSWFIQKLCNKIDTLSSRQDLESIITEVKREVAIVTGHMKVEKTGEILVCKQIPVTTSTLIRKLYLKKFGERALEETTAAWAVDYGVSTQYAASTSRQCIESRQEILDVANSSHKMPLLDQFESCSCFLDYFTYMRECLRYFVAENPNDETGKGILKVAHTYADSDDFNKSKDEMCKVISQYLMVNAQDSQFYKYLYFVPVERKVTKPKKEQNELSMSLKSSFSSVDICLTGIFAAAFCFVLRNVKSN